MPHTPFPMPTLALHGKGRFRILVLRSIQDKPMHGYEVIRSLEARAHGFYKPSPGAVYPALRSLLREGLVQVSGGERRKVYRITRKGRAFLRSREAEIERRYRSFEESVGPERAALLRDMRTMGKLMTVLIKDLTPEQAKEIAAVLRESKKKVLEIVGE